MAALAGLGEIVDTTASLGVRGVCEMSEVLKDQKIVVDAGPVYVANHYREIADLAMLHLVKGQMQTIATAGQINSWLDTQEQVHQLITVYLTPLQSQLDKTAEKVFEKWMLTVYYT